MRAPTFFFTYIVSLLCREEIYVESFNTATIKFVCFLVRTESAQENIASHFIFSWPTCFVPGYLGPEVKARPERYTAAIGTAIGTTQRWQVEG